MTSSQFILSLCLGLLVLRWLAATALSNLNKRHVQAHADRIPREFEGIMDPPTYARSVEYTLAKARFGSFEDSVSTAILIAVLCLGFLPWSQSIWTQSFGSGAWAGAGWLSAVGLILSSLISPSRGGPNSDWKIDLASIKVPRDFGFSIVSKC